MYVYVSQQTVKVMDKQQISGVGAVSSLRWQLERYGVTMMEGGDLNSAFINYCSSVFTVSKR